MQVQYFLPDVNQIAGEFVDRLEAKSSTEDGRVPNLRVEVGKWTLENAGKMVFDKRLGLLVDSGEAFGQKMVDANREVLKVRTE